MTIRVSRTDTGIEEKEGEARSRLVRPEGNREASMCVSIRVRHFFSNLHQLRLEETYDETTPLSLHNWQRLIAANDSIH